MPSHAVVKLPSKLSLPPLSTNVPLLFHVVERERPAVEPCASPWLLNGCALIMIVPPLTSAEMIPWLINATLAGPFHGYAAAPNHSVLATHRDPRPKRQRRAAA